jgi:Lectin C-type domain
VQQSTIVTGLEGKNLRRFLPSIIHPFHRAECCHKNSHLATSTPLSPERPPHFFYQLRRRSDPSASRSPPPLLPSSLWPTLPRAGARSTGSEPGDAPGSLVLRPSRSSPPGSPRESKPTGSPTASPTLQPTNVPSASPTTTCVASQLYGGHHYSAVSSGGSGLTWTEANAAAQALSCCGVTGHLATMADAAENDFIRLNLGGVQGWIGFNDIASEGTFVWVTGEPVTFTSWNSGEPNNSGGIENCAEISGSGGGWNDLPCDGQANARRSAFIVEFDCNFGP